MRALHCAAAIGGALLLSGCGYQPPAQRDVSLTLPRLRGVPPDWTYRGGGYSAPPAPQPDPPLIEDHSASVIKQHIYPVPAPRPPIDNDEDDHLPAPIIPKPAPKLALPETSPPLTDIEKTPPATGVSPDDACIGAWRPCHVLPQARADPPPVLNSAPTTAPLVDIERSPPATSVSPDDPCVGAWRPCYILNLF